ncbi:tweety homolog 2 [Pelobates cultripes]|uniref:Protein tweety homolog n=1 Tax=Pelobates cultripes TaxID=61616 RepID=A0AAD1S5C6_PELCU|nr:tweety homolog 2 [Pelobates cultripes]
MAAARVEYIAPWWVYWLHELPHLDLTFQPRGNDFQPRDPGYQQTLLFWALAFALCAAINLLFLTVCLVCFCCCKKDEQTETKNISSCCITWTAAISGLLCCAAVGIGFYGNSETNDGVYQLTYSLDNANHTLAGIDSLRGEGEQFLQCTAAFKAHYYSAAHSGQQQFYIEILCVAL